MKTIICILIILLIVVTFIYFKPIIIGDSKESMALFKPFNNNAIPAWGLDNTSYDISDFLKKLEFHSANERERAMYHINNDESDIFKLHPSKHYIPIIPNQPNFDLDMNHYLERSNQHKKQNNNNIPKEQPIVPQQHKHFPLFSSFFEFLHPKHKEHRHRHHHNKHKRHHYHRHHYHRHPHTKERDHKTLF